MGPVQWRMTLPFTALVALWTWVQPFPWPALAQDGKPVYTAEFDRTISLLRAGKPAEALAAANQLVLARPERFEPYYYRAYAYLKLNKPLEAQRAVKLAATHAPEDQKRLVARLSEMVTFTRRDPGKHFLTMRPIFRAPIGSVRSYITGVVIDARGTKIRRAMDPKIRLPDGSKVWGSTYLDPEYVIGEGVVSYVHTLEEADRNTRCGRFPLVFKAVSAGAQDCDVVLSAEDVTKLLNADRNSGFLKANQVVVVIDD